MHVEIIQQCLQFACIFKHNIKLVIYRLKCMGGCDKSNIYNCIYC